MTVFWPGFPWALGVTDTPLQSLSMIEPEEHIVQRAVAGNAEAFGVLYDKYLPQIYRFVLLKVSTKQEAEDIAHQVFLNAWLNIASWKPQGFPFSSWLYRIARNRIIDSYRSLKPSVALDEDMETRFSDIFSVATLEASDTALLLEDVQKAITTLKPEYQDIIIMRFVEDMSIKDIAAIIEKSEGAVKLLQHRAIAQLQKILKHTDHETY